MMTAAKHQRRFYWRTTNSGAALRFRHVGGGRYVLDGVAATGLPYRARGACSRLLRAVVGVEGSVPSGRVSAKTRRVLQKLKALRGKWA